jgi:hypothetical protein
MTLLLIHIMFLFIMFLVCSGSMLDIVIVDTKFMHRFAKRLAQYLSGLSGRHCVSMVFIRCLPADAPYIPDCVVDRESDSLIESFVVYLPFVGQVRCGYEGSQALFLIFLSNVPYV